MIPMGAVAAAYSLSVGPAVLRLGLAVVLGGLVGLERELRGRSAGLRTHLMVCLGATMVMLTASAFPNPGRLAQGALTGIGFIGAGAILSLKGRIHGLTTAAGIWFMAALGVVGIAPAGDDCGVVLGVGAYAEAVIGTAVVLAVLHGLWIVESRISSDTYRELTVRAERGALALADARDAVEQLGYRIETYESTDDLAAGEVTLIFNVRFRPRQVSDELLLKRLGELPGVRAIAWRLLSR